VDHQSGSMKVISSQKYRKGEMDVACGQHRWNMGEGASADKLLFGVSGIAIGSVKTLGHTNFKMTK
jgi:hypothetical protein